MSKPLPALFVPLALFLSIFWGGCESRHSMVYYAVTSNSTYTCCRTMRYSTAEFPQVEASSVTGEGTIVKLLGDSLVASCGADAEIPLVIANNGESDIYIPISHEMEGNRIKLYPWRFLYDNGKPMRLARQLQFGDLLERTDARLQFYRLPHGKEIRLQGMIPSAWLCAPAAPIPQGYLEQELNPTYYADYSRTLRASSGPAPAGDPGSILLRYDVVYTPLDFWGALPGSETTWNGGHDSAQIQIGVKEEPSVLLNGSQHVAQSNAVVMTLRR